LSKISLTSHNYSRCQGWTSYGQCPGNAKFQLYHFWSKMETFCCRNHQKIPLRI